MLDFGPCAAIRDGREVGSPHFSSQENDEQNVKRINLWYPPCGLLGDVKALVDGVINHVDEEPYQS